MLEMQNMSKHFRGVHALKDVNATFYPKEIHGLVGENGAGKSTLMKVLAGVYIPDAGTMKLNGKTLHLECPIDAYNEGIRIVHQELSLITSLSIAENINIHTFRKASPLKRVAREKIESDVTKMLNDWGININPGLLVQYVPTSVRQLVEIARELSSGGKVIILDEPTSSLTFKEIDELFRILQILKSEGYIIIFISHRLNEVTDLVDRITVLRDGEMMATEKKEDLTHKQMVKLIAGKQIENLFPKSYASIDGVALEVKGISGEGFNTMDIKVHWGEILGIAGLVGAGRSELIRALYGVNKRYTGEIYINGELVDITTPTEGVNHSIGFLSESRSVEGIFPELTVAQNLIMLKIKSVVGKLFLKPEKIKAKTDKLVESLQIVSANPYTQRLAELSGGNQQKAVLGRLIGVDPKILVLDEPTRGVDVANKTEIHSIIGKFVKAGGAVIMVSSEIDEMIGVSDRIMVLHEGDHKATFDRKDFNKEELLLCMMNVEKKLKLA